MPTEAQVSTRLKTLEARMDTQEGKIDHLSTQIQEMKELMEKLLQKSPEQSGKCPEEGESSEIIIESATLHFSLFLRSNSQCLMAQI
ncbi:hypothetical protein Lser_V15G33149 [Lactuca serriola]